MAGMRALAAFSGGSRRAGASVAAARLSARAPGRARVPGSFAAPAATRAVAVSSSDGGGGPQVTTTGRHLKVTPAMRAHVDEKVAGALAHFQGGRAPDRGPVRRVEVRLSARGGASHRTKGAPQQKAEVTVHTALGLVRAEESEQDMYKAIDLACHKLSRTLRKVREKNSRAHGGRSGGARQGGGFVFEEADAGDPVAEDGPGSPSLDLGSFDYSFESLDWAEYEVPEPQGPSSAVQGEAEVMRRKDLPLTPMSVAEAVENIKMIGHDFYAFQEQESGALQILYKRHDVGFGLLTPKVLGQDGKE